MGTYSKTSILTILLITISLSLFKVSGQSCKGYSFSNNQVFEACNDLPVLNSYLYWNYDSTAKSADIAYRVTGVGSSQWIAWALNPTGSGMTGAQALVAHRSSSGGGGVVAFTSDVKSTAITTLTNSTISFEVKNLRAMAGSNNEMIIFATIRPPSTRVNQAWQMGPLSSSGSPQAHPLTGDNVKSSGSIDFQSGQTTSTGSAANSRQRNRNVHGVLNAVSWGTMMPLGFIIARYLRVFKSADPLWFYLHIACQFSAYVIGVAGWGTGLKLGSDSVGIVYQAHRNIGISLFCLATLQVFALLLRPKKEHKYRLYWNMYHHSVGYAVIILSVINVYKGLDILDPAKKWKKTYTGVIIALGAIAVALEAFTWVVVLKRKKDETPNKHGDNNAYSNGYGARTQPAV